MNATIRKIIRYRKWYRKIDRSQFPEIDRLYMKRIVTTLIEDHEAVVKDEKIASWFESKGLRVNRHLGSGGYALIKLRKTKRAWSI